MRSIFSSMVNGENAEHFFESAQRRNYISKFEQVYQKSRGGNIINDIPARYTTLNIQSRATLYLYYMPF